MTKRQKRAAKLCSRPFAEASLADVVAVLEERGWSLDRQEGSHVHYVKQGRILSFPLVSGRKIKPFYVSRICAALDEE